MNDRRQHQRIRTLKFGKIAHIRKDATLDCLVRNLSVGGACLQIDILDGLPEQFYLKVPVENLKQLCRIVWKSEDRIGVAFHRPLQSVDWLAV